MTYLGERILKLLRDTGRALSAAALAERLDEDAATVADELDNLKDEGLVSQTLSLSSESWKLTPLGKDLMQ